MAYNFFSNDIVSVKQASSPALGEMNLDEFRQHGHDIVEWIADYLAAPKQYPVLSRCRPGDIKEQLSDQPPQAPDELGEILNDFHETIIPGITHWNHPGFFGYFGISGSAPGILGDLLASALNVNAMLWRTSPAATELEEVVLDWLRQMLGLPSEFSGVIVDTASMATLTAMAAARETLNLDIRSGGMAGRTDIPRLCVYTSTEAHSSVAKAAITLGIGRDNVRLIDTDDLFRMDVGKLKEAIEQDRAQGMQPFCVVATVGTTSTTSIDPVQEIAKMCQEYDLWLHVDGAYGGMAAIVDEKRHVLVGCEHADSIVVNPHKWLFTPIDCSAFYVRDPAILKRAFSLVPEYLETKEESVTNYMDWGVALGRRFRALKLWMVIRYFGQEGLSNRIREHMRLAQDLAKNVDEHPDFERLAPVPFSTICFRVKPKKMTKALTICDPDTCTSLEAYLDKLNEAVINEVNAKGDVFLSHTRVNGHYAMRIAIGNIRSNDEYVQRVWERICTVSNMLHDEFSRNAV